MPDVELDAYVETIVARFASFDRTSLASAKAMINRAVLPPDADLIAAYSEFGRSLSRAQREEMRAAVTTWEARLQTLLAS